MKKEQQIMENILIELYDNSEPKANFLKLKEEFKNTQIEFFWDYYLAIDKQEEIIDNHLRKSRLPKYKKKMIRNSILLGVSPNSKL